MPCYMAKYSKSLKSSTSLPVWRALGVINNASTPVMEKAYRGTMFNIAHLGNAPRGTRNAIYNRAGYIIYNGYMSGANGNVGSYIEDLEANTLGLITGTPRKGLHVLNEAAKNLMGGNIIEGNATVNVPNTYLTASVVSGNATIHGGTFKDSEITGSATVCGGTYERVLITGNANLTIEGEATITGSTFGGDTTLHYTANGECKITGHTPAAMHEDNRDLLWAFRFAVALYDCGTVHTFCLESKKHNKECKCGLYAPQAYRESKIANEYMELVNARSTDTARLETLEAEMNKEFTLRTIAKWSRELR